MTSAKKQHRRVSPMPVVSSFPPPNRETVHSECISWFMTPEELAAYNEKNGYPTMKLSDRRGHHYMEAKKGVKKDAKKQVRSKKDAS